MIVYKSFEDIKFAKGFLRGLSIDLTRESWNYIPNEVIDTVQRINGVYVNDSTLKEYQVILNKYDNILFFKCPASLLSNFAPLTEDFYQPSHFSSAVIFVSQLYPSYLDCLFKQLEVSNCHDIALVFHNCFNSQLLKNYISASGFENIEIYISIRTI